MKLANFHHSKMRAFLQRILLLLLLVGSKISREDCLMLLACCTYLMTGYNVDALWSRVNVLWGAEVVWRSINAAGVVNWQILTSLSLMRSPSSHTCLSSMTYFPTYRALNNHSKTMSVCCLSVCLSVSLSLSLWMTCMIYYPVLPANTRDLWLRLSNNFMMNFEFCHMKPSSDTT